MQHWQIIAVIWLGGVSAAFAQAPAVPAVSPPAASAKAPAVQTPPAASPVTPAVAPVVQAPPVVAPTAPVQPPVAVTITKGAVNNVQPIPAVTQGQIAPPPGQRAPISSLPGTPTTKVAPAVLVPVVPARPPYKSIMFAEPDMGKIYSSAQTYRVNLAKAKEMARKAGQPMTPEMLAKAQNEVIAQPQQQEKERSVEHPQFYLAFIGFNNESNWTLWMNKHKYTQDHPKFGDVEVLAVTQTSARFSWRPKMFPVYEDRAATTGSTDRVRVVRDNETIEFTLFPNQSFSAFSMGIVEGFLPPTRVEQFTTAISVTDTAGEADPSKPATSAAPAPPATVPLPAPR